jgi:hypothetical protein
MRWVGEVLAVEPIRGGVVFQQQTHELTMPFGGKPVPGLPLQNEPRWHSEQLRELQWVYTEGLS